MCNDLILTVESDGSISRIAGGPLEEPIETRATHHGIIRRSEHADCSPKECGVAWLLGRADAAVRAGLDLVDYHAGFMVVEAIGSAKSGADAEREPDTAR